MRALFYDQQTTVMHHLLDTAVEEAEELHGDLYLKYAPLLRFLADTSVPAPKVFRFAAEIVLNRRIESLFEAPELEPEVLTKMLAEINRNQVSLHESEVREVAVQRLAEQTRAVREHPEDTVAVEAFADICQMAIRLPLDISLWKARNACYEILQVQYTRRCLSDENDDLEWCAAVEDAATTLRIRLPDISDKK